MLCILDISVGGFENPGPVYGEAFAPSLLMGVGQNVVVVGGVAPWVEERSSARGWVCVLGFAVNEKKTQ